MEIVIPSRSEKRRKEYKHILDQLYNDHKKGKIDFLQYQGLSYDAINEVIAKNKLKSEHGKNAARRELESIWEDFDPAIRELTDIESIEKTLGGKNFMSTYDFKMRYLGRALAEKYTKKISNQKRK